MPELFIGLMSGTSLDGIDAALVDFALHPPQPLVVHSHAIPDAVRAELLSLCQGGSPDELATMARLDVQLGRLFAEAARALLHKANVPANAVRAIGSHGQTVRHSPAGEFPFSVQIGDPNTIAQLTGITTVADFRRRDIAAGGQGAPLVPAFHAAVFRSADEDRAVLNIGGIANITVLPGADGTPVTGFDTGPGNVLMDAWAARHLGTTHDADGHWAGSAATHPALLDLLLDDDFFHRSPPKSTGRELFNMNWLETRLARMSPAPEPSAVQASLCALTAITSAFAIKRHAPQTRRLLVCGGGVHNTTLMHVLAAELPNMTVESTRAHGLDPDWVEALAFAWLARQTLDGQAGNLPGVTGARLPVVLGGIYLSSSE